MGRAHVEGDFEAPLRGEEVVLCLGNPYMRDDGVGLEVARLIARDHPEVKVVAERESVDLSSVWRLRGARKLIVVDAVSGGDPPGTVSRHVIAPRDGPISHVSGLHDSALHDAVDLARAESDGFPVVIVGVEPKDCGAGEGLTREVEAALPSAVAAVVRELGLDG